MVKEPERHSRNLRSIVVGLLSKAGSETDCVLAADHYAQLFREYERATGTSVPGGLRALIACQSIG